MFCKLVQVASNTLVEEHLPAGVVAAKHSAAKFCDTLVDVTQVQLHYNYLYGVYDS